MTKEFQFLMHMQRLMFEAEALAKEYDVEDRFISIMFAGLITETLEGEAKLNAMYNMNIQDFNELQEILDFIDNAYQNETRISLSDDDLNDLLSGTGIELE